MKKIYILLFLFALTVSCQKDTVPEPVVQKDLLKDSYRNGYFEELLPPNAEIVWNNRHKAYSSEMEAEIIEIPIHFSYINSEKKRNPLSFTLIAIPDNGKTESAKKYDFYLTKFLHSGTVKAEVSLLDFKNFSGILKVFDLKGRTRLSQMFSNGTFLGDTHPLSDLNKQNAEMDNCLIVTIEHITDWYQVFEDGHREWTSTTIKYTQETVCNGSGSGNGTPDGGNPPTNEPHGGGGGTSSPDDEQVYLERIDRDLDDDWSTDIVLLNENSGPEITNIADYIKCFNASSGAIFTIYADQPTPNSSTAWSGITDPDVGHTFISIQQNGITRIIGFYPKEGVNPFYRPESSRELVNDSDHHFDVSVSKYISSSQLSSLLKGLKNDNTVYNLNSYNCTDFGIRMAAKVGLNIGSCYGSWPGGGGDNPGQLGQTLRSSSINGIKNTNGGSAPTNSGNCN